MKYKIITFLLALTLILSGFFRDHLMININHVIKHLTVHRQNFSTPFFYPLANWELSSINVLKWSLTILFFIYFWAITYWLIRIIFKNKHSSFKAVTIIYTCLFSASGILYMGAGLFGYDKEIYPVVRTMMGISHSFVPAMLVYLYLKYLLGNTTTSASS